MPTGYKIVISCALGMYGIYCTQPSGRFAPLCFGAINAIHPSCPWYNYYFKTQPTVFSGQLLCLPNCNRYACLVHENQTKKWHHSLLEKFRWVLRPKNSHSFLPATSQEQQIMAQCTNLLSEWEPLIFWALKVATCTAKKFLMLCLHIRCTCSCGSPSYEILNHSLQYDR